MRESLRKWGKWLLPVLGVVLMFLWLQNPKGGLGQRNVYEIGTLNGKKVENTELDSAQNDVRILEELTRAEAFSAIKQFGARLSTEQQQSFLERLYPQLRARYLGFLDSRNPSLHMFLLLKEAEKNNLRASDEEVKSEIQRTGLSESDLADFFSRLRINQAMFQKTLADFVVVEKLNNLAYAGLQPSGPQLRHLADDLSSKVDVRYVALDAATPSPTAKEPSPEEIQKHFDAYKAILPTIAATDPPVVNGHTYPFGYKYPDRVKVEYLTFDRKAVRAALEEHMTAEDRRNLYMAAAQYYNEHKDEFRTAATEPTTKPGFMGATGPATTASASRLKPFDEVKQQLVDRQLARRVDDKMRQMIDTAIKTLGQPWQGPPDEKGYRTRTSPTAKPVSYETIADELAAKPDFRYRPTYNSPGSWQNRQDLQQRAGIGSAMLMSNNRPQADFATLALNVRELNDDPTRAGHLRQLQVGVEGPVLYDEAGNAYLYRVIDAEKAHEPKLEEVRDQVVRDLKRVETYQQFLQQAPALTEAAARAGLEAAAAPRKLQVESTGPFARMDIPRRPQFVGGRIEWVPTGGPEPSRIAKLGQAPQFADAAFALAEKVGPTSQPASAPATSPAAAGSAKAPATSTVATSHPGEHPVTSVAIDRRLTVFVLELANYQPIPSNQFAEERTSLSQLAFREAAQTFGSKWNSLEAIFERLKYVPKVPLGKEL